jgi:hypothetical protein
VAVQANLGLIALSAGAVDSAVGQVPKTPFLRELSVSLTSTLLLLLVARFDGLAERSENFPDFRRKLSVRFQLEIFVV